MHSYTCYLIAIQSNCFENMLISQIQRHHNSVLTKHLDPICEQICEQNGVFSYFKHYMDTIITKMYKNHSNMYNSKSSS